VHHKMGRHVGEREILRPRVSSGDLDAVLATIVVPVWFDVIWALVSRGDFLSLVSNGDRNVGLSVFSWDVVGEPNVVKHSSIGLPSRPCPL
jgi:hypothetical protein